MRCDRCKERWNVWAGIGIGATVGGLIGAGAGMFAAAAVAVCFVVLIDICN